MKTQLKSVELFITLGLVSTLALELANTNVVNAIEESAISNTYLLAEGGEGGELSEGEQANADFQDKLSGSQLLSELQQGGYVTDNSERS